MAFSRSFQNFPFTPGWKKIHSPVFYILSRSLSKAGSATVLAKAKGGKEKERAVTLAFVSASPQKPEKSKSYP